MKKRHKFASNRPYLLVFGFKLIETRVAIDSLGLDDSQIVRVVVVVQGRLLAFELNAAFGTLQTRVFGGLLRLVFL